MTPDVPFYRELLPATGKPRQRLASWVTHVDNLAFSRATVNRVWGLMFSRPLVEPVDGIPMDFAVPAPLDTLAGDFSAHGFDLRRLVRLIAASEAFQRDSRANFEITEQHEQAWSVFPLTQLRPDQVAGSLVQASKLTALDESSSIFRRLEAFGSKQDYLQRFGDRGEDEFVSEAVTITQRLVMINGELVSRSNASTSIEGRCVVPSIVGNRSQPRASDAYWATAQVERRPTGSRVVGIVTSATSVNRIKLLIPWLFRRISG